jgi:hypothetical protein
MGDAGQFFMYRALGIKDPFESALAAERGPFDRGEDGVMAIEKIIRQARKDIPGSAAQRAQSMTGVLGISGNRWLALENAYADAEARGVQMTAEDYKKADPSLGENEGSKTRETLAGIHDALTKTTSPLLSILNGIRGAVVFAAGPDYEESLLLRDKVPPAEFQAAVDEKTAEAAKWNAEESKKFRSNLARKLIPGAISAASKKTGVSPMELYRIIQVESGGDPNAVSKSGAKGLMQLMPDTAREHGVTNPFDVYQNIMGGAEHYREMLDHYKDRRLALIAYHAGRGNTDKWLAGKPSGVGPESLAYPNKVLHDLRLDVHIKDPTGKTVGRTAHEMPLDTPKSSGTSAVAVP